jgi:predicted TIM-barrel fold metal-dependent hydrolase
MGEFVDVHCTIGQDQDVPLEVEQLLPIMDQYGIEKVVLSPPHKHIVVDNHIGNDMIIALTRQFPDRFMGYASVNPWYGEKAELELRRALDAGLSGVKFHPALQGFFVFDSGKMDALMNIVGEYQVPVYIHTGTPIFALPFQVAELALSYPDIPFIMGRMGNTDFWIDVPVAYNMADNLYVDTPYTSPANIAKLIDIDSRRILFSADLPYSHAGIERQKIEDIGAGVEDFNRLTRDNFERIFNRQSRNGGRC